ncbi:hypothetical protein K431DRAFT_302391 [Polychaeton citri CBS 116435]|nr:hypothetical protein K431DRAFT_302391 [Polychaeton citri CBS 116435]
MPKGEANALAGLKIIFTGTLETMDRATAKKAAEAHGAKVITKLEDTDFIVLGVKAGPKKLQEISEKGLKTVSEAEFGEMLQGGAGEDTATDEKEGKKRAAKKGAGVAETDAPPPASKRSKRGK